MIIKCTEESVEQVIDYCKQGKVCFLSVGKSNDDFVMQYDLIEDAKRNERDNLERIIKKSLPVTYDMIKQLTKFKDVIAKTTNGVTFKLTYDCFNVNRINMPTLSYHSSYPKDITVQKEFIDWSKVFADKLDNHVPDLFIKKSAKKYSQITYKELIEILSKDN